MKKETKEKKTNSTREKFLNNLKRTPLSSSLVGRDSAFTMAEILLSLTIIGVVAAITLPSLTGNINERTWNTQRKALHARMSQAVSLLDNLRGFGDFSAHSYGEAGTWYVLNNAAETFLSAGLSKVLKLNNICSGSNITDCGMPKEVTNLAGSKIDLVYYLGYDVGSYNGMYNAYNGCGTPIGIGGPGAAFETANGESVAIIYNPGCRDLDSATISFGGNTKRLTPTVSCCVNFIYDLNGKKGPNIVGKDVGFMSAFYPSDSVVAAPVPVAKEVSGNSCSGLGDEARVPNLEELASMALNYKLIGEANFGYSGKRYQSSSRGNTTTSYNIPWTYWANSSYYMFMELNSNSSANAVRCVKR